MEVVVSSSHTVSVTFSSSGEGLLTLFPCSSVGFYPRERVLHKLLQHVSLPWPAVLHKPLPCGSLPWGAILQEQTASAVPSGITSPASKPTAAWAPVSAWVHRSFQEPDQVQVLHSLLQTSTCSGVRSFMDCRWISAPAWTSMVCGGTACLTKVFTTGFRGISAPAPGAPASCPSSPTLGVC